MEVTLNQQNYLVPDDCNVQVLLRDVLRRYTPGLAVAINETIIPKSRWEDHSLRPGDTIIIIKATQGG